MFSEEFPRLVSYCDFAACPSGVGVKPLLSLVSDPALHSNAKFALLAWLLMDKMPSICCSLLFASAMLELSADPYLLKSSDILKVVAENDQGVSIFFKRPILSFET